MKRAQLIFAVLAAVTGIGAAYASQPKESASGVDIYRWKTANGKIVFTVATAIAKARCHVGIHATCLIGTKAGAPTIVLPGTFQ